MRPHGNGRLCGPLAGISYSFCGHLAGPHWRVTHPLSKKPITEKYVARHFSGTREALAKDELDSVYPLPGTENPADSLAKEEREMVRFLHMLQSGPFLSWCASPGSGGVFFKKVGWGDAFLSLLLLLFRPLATLPILL